MSDTPSNPGLGAGASLGIAALVGTGALLVNPGYFGDAPQYAMDVLGPLLVPRLDYGIDSGHLFWRPLLGLLAAVGRPLGLAIDGLVALQVASAIAMAAIVLGVLALARKVGMTRRQQVLAVLLLAGTSSTLLVGGSGAPYTTMAALIVLAINLVTPPPAWSWRRALLAAGCMGLSWGFWGVAVMLFPAFTVAVFLGYGGTWRQRSLAAVVLSAVATLTTLAIAIITWVIWLRPHGLTFLGWIATASHGAESAPSFIGLARAVLGSMRALIDFGDLGYAVKSYMLTRTAGPVLLSLAVAGLLSMALVAGLVLSTLGTVRTARRHLRVAEAGIIGLCAWLPSFLFTVSYGGNEVHMIFGAMPFIALALVSGLDAIGPRLAPALALGIWAANLSLLFSPAAIATRSERQGVGTIARQHLPAYSALVVTGQDFIYSESLPILLRDSIRVVNVRTDVLTHGPEDWEARLDSSLAMSRRLGGSVAVLSDLLGEATSSGLKRLADEQPEPSLDALATYFGGWTRGRSWTAGRYRFIEMIPAGEETRAVQP